LQGISHLNKIKREELHDYERPVAYLAYQNAEINRDKKKRRRPFAVEDFYYYMDLANRDLPEPKYGAAAKALVERDIFPSWALFVYKDLMARANDALPPEVLCLEAEDVIVLAPSIEEGMIGGMVIAGKTASEQIRELRSPCGQQVTVRMPKIADMFTADEEAQLRIIA
jgi:hypothetical protein